VVRTTKTTKKKNSVEVRALPKGRTASAKAETKAAPLLKPKALKSPLNKKEMEPYRRLLVELKTKLIREVRVNQEASNENSGDVLDLADLASDSYDKDLANSLSEAERGRLNAVESALKRVDEGVYGLCDTCTKPIPLARLKVLPFAKLCVPCQQGEEGLSPRRSPISEE